MSRRTHNSLGKQFVTKRYLRSVENAVKVFGCNSSPPGSSNVTLYRLVFKSQKAVGLVLLLCVSFFLQPFHQASADTEPIESAVQEELNQVVTADDTSVVSVTSDDPLPEPSPEDAVVDDIEEVPTPEIEETNAPPQGEELTDTSEQNDSVGDDTESSIDAIADDKSGAVEEPEVVEPPEQVVSPTGESAPESTQDNPEAVESPDETVTDETELFPEQADETEEGEMLDTPSGTESDDNQSGTTVEPKPPGGGEPTEEVTQNTQDGQSQEAPATDTTEETASSTETSEQTDEIVSFNDEGLISVVESDSLYSFEKNECTKIEDGSFYCQKQRVADTPQEGLFAAPDADGDMEIFLIQEGRQIQITFNTVDDASPYFDEISNTIVWHRLINDRFQIVSYDVLSGAETQLTNTRVNDMEPTRHGDYTVWQRWVDNNWQIMLHDGKNERQITNSSRHNIAPHIRGSLVIWNSRSNDGTQSLMTYDIGERTYTTIADGDGVSVSNPRMVVLYEARYKNGDVIMKGYDLVSGEIIDLETLPRPLPSEIPNSETTGETRAIVQSKPTPKHVDAPSGADGVSDGDDGSLDEEPEATLDLRSADETIEDSSDDSLLSPEIEIPDLIVPPFETAPTSSQANSE